MAQETDEQLEFLRLIVSRLESTGIPYMVTGSVAVMAFGIPRATRDVDFVIEANENSIDTIVALFSKDCYIAREAVEEAVEHRSMFNVIHNEWVAKADFVVRKNDPYRIEEFERRRRVDVTGIQFNVVSPEDLVLSKLVWAKDSESEKQLRDVRSVLKIVPSIDRDYLEAWAARLGVSELLTKALQNA